MSQYTGNNVKLCIGAEQWPIKDQTMAAKEAAKGNTGGIMKIRISRDKNSSFYMSNHVDAADVSGFSYRCNQGLKPPEQAICSPPNSTSISPLIIPSTDFPSSVLSHLSSASSSEQDHDTSHSAR